MIESRDVFFNLICKYGKKRDVLVEQTHTLSHQSTGLPACVVKPLQMIQNAAARLVFNQPKRAHVTPLLIDLHWLPVAARIKFKSLMLAYRVLDGSAPT